MNFISQEDIDTHNKEGGAWAVIHGKVYDLLSFTHRAPSGSDRLLASVGKDASKDFDAAGYSDFTHDLLEQCLVGNYRDAEVRGLPGRDLQPVHMHM